MENMTLADGYWNNNNYQSDESMSELIVSFTVCISKFSTVKIQYFID